MQNIKKTTIKFLAVLLMTLLICVSCTAGGLSPWKVSNPKSTIKTTSNILPSPTAGTEYWALIFAVGVYYNHPNQDRPSMLEAADDLYEVLIDSPQWQPDHIHVVKGAQATGQALIRELLWLRQMDDSDDMCLIYLTTHGSPLRNSQGYPVDLPPKDEPDGADEMLVMYHGFENWYAFIWDDLLNFLISLLQSQGVLLIVDSCYSGGFNDLPFFTQQTTSQTFTAEAFTKDMTQELSSQGRIVLMSSEEHTPSYGSDFSDFLIQGLWGWADFFGNQDGVNSAEEAFAYAQFWVDLLGNQHPTMRDLFPGEYPVTT
ncbi:MAG: caspase family protein [Candidatus Thermoplasmatota archaeon]|nr:caspase family protein [Candidatus Thermoplasmatota archaeon]MBU1941057.1 caspase family protein [Candidatus Thermoplasmatota archaeon]